MQNVLETYIQSISSKFSHEETSEYGYRTDFEILLKNIFESIKVSRFDNDPKAKAGNKPDFVVIKDDVPLLYIETKDIGVSLYKVEKSEQMGRYFGYANLVLTDYLEFRFYRNGLPYGEPIKIGSYDIKNRLIYPTPENYELLAKTLLEFTQNYKEPIKSGKHLAKIMAGKARRIRDNIRQFLVTELDKGTELVKLYNSIKKYLVHDLTAESFADMYAQTLVYGLFIARFNDTTKDNFTRNEARDLIPNSNPFLRSFFDHIVGIDFDTRLKFIVDELCEVFSHSNIEDLLKQFSDEDLWGKTHKKPDPVIYFYEDFLKEYDPILRKKMGAYYTPEPVVQFIVRAVDNILKKDFKLPKGLGDTSKTPEGLHKVQILDPATGTGTFISAVIRSIYKPFKANKQEAAWPSYVQNELLPRIFGFEIMMAPYTIAHLKLSLAFKETGFKYFNSKRLGIYLTNSLEGEGAQQNLFPGVGLSESIAKESIEASKIKNEKPIMIVIGNPPYSGISSNETKYANGLVERYKVEPGGKQKLQERKHWLNDDYVKFIAMAESMIEKNGDGIIGMITNNGYLDNPTFRGMRWHLAKTFDKIYILDLHGNAKKKETTLNGNKDENVFNIMQGVGLILAVKINKKKDSELGEVLHSEIYGTRKTKFEELEKIPKWGEINLDAKMFYFVPKNNQGKDEYDKGFKINELFHQSTTGVITAKDHLVIDSSASELANRMRFFADIQYSDTEIRNKFFSNKKPGKYMAGDSRGWKLPLARKKLLNEEIVKNIKIIEYRPFDRRYVYYSPTMVDWGRFSFAEHYKDKNLTLGFARSQKDGGFSAVFATVYMMEAKCTERSVQSSFAPLYLHNEDDKKVPNLDNEIVTRIKHVVGDIIPENIFDYVYAVLYSPSYRERYREFLKIDFPRVPYPKDKKTFEQLVKFGKELRELHLMESPKLDNLITTFNVEGSNIVEKVEYKNRDVYINKSQYFGGVSEVAWNFYIGGYQPAQKWLKDRKGRELTSDDIEHYQKVIVALVETDKIMKEIDRIKF